MTTTELSQQQLLLAIEEELRRAVPQTGDSDLLYRMMNYHLGWVDAKGAPIEPQTGKRLRPLFCLLACASMAGDYRAALPAAAALELLHNFTLIHDDIQDKSYERHHRPTVWAVYGIAQAINAGDAMYALSHAAIHRLPQQGISPERALQAAALLNRTCLLICEGQCLDLDFERRSVVSSVEYFTMVERKTAVLLASSLQLGALAGGADESAQQRLYELGLALGAAYQIQDDILGIWGDPERTGKPAADDLRNRKKTLPYLLAIEESEPATAAALRAAFAAPAGQAVDVDALLPLLEHAGARQRCEQLAEARILEAIQLMRSLPLQEPARSLLTRSVESLLHRRF